MSNVFNDHDIKVHICTTQELSWWAESRCTLHWSSMHSQQDWWLLV